LPEDGTLIVNAVDRVGAPVWRLEFDKGGGRDPLVAFGSSAAESFIVLSLRHTLEMKTDLPVSVSSGGLSSMEERIP